MRPSLSQVDLARPVLTGLAAKTWYAGTDKDAPRNKDGTFRWVRGVAEVAGVELKLWPLCGVFIM